MKSLWAVVRRLSDFGPQHSSYSVDAFLFLPLDPKVWTQFKLSQAIKSARNEDSNKRKKKEAGWFDVVDMQFDYQSYLKSRRKVFVRIAQGTITQQISRCHRICLVHDEVG
jgi:hypothetical protein